MKTIALQVPHHAIEIKQRKVWRCGLDGVKVVPCEERLLLNTGSGRFGQGDQLTPLKFSAEVICMVLVKINGSWYMIKLDF